MRKRKGLFYGAENRNGHQRSPERSACGIAWEEGFGISEIFAGRQEESCRKGNAEGGKTGGAGKYKGPLQERQAEGTAAHQGHRACGLGGAKKIFLTKING